MNGNSTYTMHVQAMVNTQQVLTCASDSQNKNVFIMHAGGVVQFCNNNNTAVEAALVLNCYVIFFSACS